MPERVRVGVMGTSRFAELLHLGGLRNHPRVELAAICGRNRERAEEVAKTYGAARVFTDWRELIERGELDAVVIVTPDDLHYPMTMAALDAGLHVLCEKPLALTAADAERMYHRAEEVGVKHMTFFTYRWQPHWQYVQQLVAEGYVGRPYHVTTTYFAGYRYHAQTYGWRFDRRRANGALGDFGPHMLDMLRLLVGDVSAIAASLTNVGGGPGPNGEPLDPANDSATLALRFANGAQGTLQLSTVAQVAGIQRQRLELHGEDGTLALDNSFAGTTLLGARRGAERSEELAIPAELWGAVDQSLPAIPRLVQLLATQPVGDRLFIDAILEDRPLSPSFYDGWKAQQVIQAALDSDREGRWVTVK